MKNIDEPAQIAHGGGFINFMVKGASVHNNQIKGNRYESNEAERPKKG